MFQVSAYACPLCFCNQGDWILEYVPRFRRTSQLSGTFCSSKKTTVYSMMHVWSVHRLLDFAYQSHEYFASADGQRSVPRYRWKEEHLWVAALSAWGVAAYAFSAAREARKKGEKSKGSVAIQRLMSSVKK
jgi:hypothetical protein